MPARYRDIAQHLARSIQEGLLRPGERLPSLRSLCLSEGASLMTALAAYRWLEDQGFVEAQPRSGYRVMPDKVLGLQRPAIPRPRLTSFSGERARLLSQVLASTADPDCLPLGFGCPSAELFPLPALRRLTASLLNAQPHLWATYSSPPGHLELRRLIARRLHARGLKVNASEILLTTGGMEALSLSLRLLLNPGDLVAVECPTFFGLLNAARQAGGKVIEVPGDPVEGVDPGRFAELCTRHPIRAAVLIPSFANPSGSLMSDERKREWMKVLKTSGVALVEDDLYGELAWDGRKPKPMCAFGDKDSVPSILVGSFSKTLLPGGRVGYVVARSPWIERLTELKSDSTLANATLPEHLAAECLSSGLYDRHLRHLVPRLHRGVRSLREGIASHFPAGTRVSDPRGGFMLWVELPQGSDSLPLFHSAMKKGISIAPGCLFTLGPGLDRFVRLNGGATGDLEKAIAILGRLAARKISS